MSELQRTLLIDADHPALAGHFPGNPLIPGALLLDEVLHAIEQAHSDPCRDGEHGGAPLQGWQIEVVKFLRTARAAEPLQLTLRPETDTRNVRYEFEVSAHGQPIVRGRVTPCAPAAQGAGMASSDATGSRGAHEQSSADQGWRDRPERGHPLLMRWMAALSLRLGRPMGRVLLYLIAAYYFCFAPRAAAAMRGYLRRALGREPRARDRMRLIVSFASTIHDRLWLLRERQDMFAITLEGEPVVREAVTGGGAFLMGAHVGSFEVLRLVGRRQGFTVAISMYEAQAQRLNAVLSALAPSEALEIIPVGQVDSMLRLSASLEAGHLVGVLADRLFALEPALAVDFLGATAQFPINPMRLAAILRTRVVFMLGLYRGANRYHVVFEPLADFSHVTPANRQAAIEAAVRRFAQQLERRCRSDPYNWFNFFDFWPTALPATAAAAARASQSSS
ncbi:MAG TPA: hypothetical protein VHY19_05675 [Steroidobacteraceae bacterium]|jgi:predicted LPLAT superfamily acyltransferase/3-hydroxymyristoyl/3-hydroxydecanoyl-(acyl carrier protein) dehydratase|nr:hypothetical protein [Steroidobacteraceae bacterium]